jgi:hypothetical protein
MSVLRLGGVLLASVTLAGCASEIFPSRPEMVWLRVDGQRGNGNPALTQQFETDRTLCLGRTQQDDERNEPVDAPAKECMIEKGYIQVPKDQAEAKQAELAAANLQKPVPPSARRKPSGQ